MLYRTDLEKISQMPMGDMSEHKGRKVELYRSCNPDIIGRYFAGDKGPAKFEVLVFEYHQSKERIFIRYPNSNFFIPIVGGFGTSRGSMMEGGGEDVIGEIINPLIRRGKHFVQYIGVNVHETEMFLQFGWNEGEFNFLRRIAAANMAKYDNFVSGENNDALIEEALGRKYIKIPDFRKIEYAFMTVDENFILTDRSVHNYQYETLRCWFGNSSGMKEGKIKNFGRARDGGSTKFQVVIEEDKETHDFYSPTPFNPELKATWDGKEIIPIDITRQEELIQVLKSQGVVMEMEIKKVRLEDQAKVYEEA